MDYFDSIMKGINEDVNINESGLVGSALGAAGSKIITNTIGDRIKFPIDKKIKTAIEKKVKLEMKIKKIKEKSPESSDIIKELESELKDIEKELDKSTSKEDAKNKDIIRQYTNKCELDYGPKSLFYFSIKIPKTVKEAMDDIVNGDYTIESTDSSKKKKMVIEKIKKAVESKGYKLNISKKGLDTFLTGSSNGFISDINNLCLGSQSKDSWDDVYNIIKETIKDDKDFEVYKDNYFTIFISIKPNSSLYTGKGDIKESIYDLITSDYDYLIEEAIDGKETNNDSDNENTTPTEQKETKEEFSIGSMLPQCGSTDGVGDPNTVVSSVEKFNKSLEDGKLNNIELPDDIEIESIQEYVQNPDIPYDFYVEKSLSNFVDKVRIKGKISSEIRKAVVKKAAVKAKLRIAKIKRSDPMKITELKKELVQREKELRILKNGLDADTIKAIEDFAEELDKKFGEIDSVDESVNDNINCECASEKQAYLENTRSEKEEIEEKLEAAMESNNLTAIRTYENKLRYIKAHEEIDAMLEAANIDSEIKPVIDLLNKKGYKTKYSSAGHTRLRKKEDGGSDGVYYGKLYSDARIMFDADYDFPKPPKYWVWKNVDGKDYLDIIPIAYNEKDGTPNEAFAKWKKNYMNTLRTWVDNLPDQNKSADKVITNDKKGRTIVQESSIDVDEYYSDFTESLFDEFDM